MLAATNVATLHGRLKGQQRNVKLIKCILFILFSRSRHWTLKLWKTVQFRNSKQQLQSEGNNMLQKGINCMSIGSLKVWPSKFFAYANLCDILMGWHKCKNIACKLLVACRDLTTYFFDFRIIALAMIEATARKSTKQQQKQGRSFNSNSSGLKNLCRWISGQNQFKACSCNSSCSWYLSCCSAAVALAMFMLLQLVSNFIDFGPKSWHVYKHNRSCYCRINKTESAKIRLISLLRYLIAICIDLLSAKIMWLQLKQVVVMAF